MPRPPGSPSGILTWTASSGDVGEILIGSAHEQIIVSKQALPQLVPHLLTWLDEEHVLVKAIPREDWFDLVHLAVALQ